MFLFRWLLCGSHTFRLRYNLPEQAWHCGGVPSRFGTVHVCWHAQNLCQQTPQKPERMGFNFLGRIQMCLERGDPHFKEQGRRHGFLSGGGGTNRQQMANLPPKYPKYLKRHRIWATSFSNLEGTSLPKFFTGGNASPPSPPPPLSTPMSRRLLWRRLNQFFWHWWGTPPNFPFILVFNPISGRLLATPISGKGGCLGPPLISPVLTGRFLKFKRHSFRLNMIYISKKEISKIRRRGY